MGAPTDFLSHPELWTSSGQRLVPHLLLSHTHKSRKRAGDQGPGWNLQAPLSLQKQGASCGPPGPSAPVAAGTCGGATGSAGQATHMQRPRTCPTSDERSTFPHPSFLTGLVPSALVRGPSFGPGPGPVSPGLRTSPQVCPLPTSRSWSPHATISGQREVPPACLCSSYL